MPWLRRTSWVVITSSLLVGCGQLLGDVQLGDSTGGTGASSTGATLVTTSSSLDSGSTLVTGATSEPSTGGSSGGSSSGDTTGLLLQCGDAMETPGEYCHTVESELALSIDVCDVEIAHIDGTAHADLVMSACGVPEVYTLIGSDFGLTVPPGRLTVSVGPSPISNFALGDFWGDGRAEMVAATPSGAMLVFHSEAAVFDTSSTISFSDPITEVEAGRIGDDKWSDVIGVDPVAMNGDSAWQVELFGGIGVVGDLGAPVEYDFSITHFEARLSDLDGDLHPELLLAHYGEMTRRVAAYHGESGGFSPVASFTPIGGLVAYDAGDLDGDGDRDFVAITDSADGMFVYEQGAPLDFAFVGAQSLALPDPQLPTLADLDHDGRDDLITMHGDQLLVSRSVGRLDFEMMDTVTLPDPGTHIRVGDVDGDSVPDVVVVTNAGTVVQLLSDP